MAAARVDYIVPWWAVRLHSLPHLTLHLQPVDSTFNPQDPRYQESLLLLGLVAGICLGLNLIFVTLYLICCCCDQDEEEEIEQPKSPCINCTSLAAGLLCCAAVGVGFHGNNQTNYGVYQLIYSLDNASHILSGIDELVSGAKVKVNLEQHLARLNEIFATQGDYIHTLKFIKKIAGNINLPGLPLWREVSIQLTEITNKITYVEYYRWFSYLLLFIVDLVIFLTACLGLAKHSKCLLAMMLCCGVITLPLSWASLAAETAAAVGTSDFCVAPDQFILNVTQSKINTAITRYYLHCSQGQSNPFQQALTIFQGSLTTMKIGVLGLLQFAVPFFPKAEKDLLGIWLLLNTSESSLHQLTAMLDCRGLHKEYLNALTGVCYDGIEGLLCLSLFSLLAAMAFSTMICAGAQAWKYLVVRDSSDHDRDKDDPFNVQALGITSRKPTLSPLQSFWNYSSNVSSQTSLHSPAKILSNAPLWDKSRNALWWEPTL